MEFETENHNEVLIVRLLEPRLDAALSVRFKEAMREVADESTEEIVLDLANVTFMDSSGLGAVVAVMKHMGRERVFKIASLTPAVDKVFKLTRMDSVFQILESAQDAIEGGLQEAG
ncbi:MAG: STAS domain-containing protein [Rhodobacteraceae bacterium]|nr:STAS domain-containing protein [Paracoccaceae bacterium]